MFGNDQPIFGPRSLATRLSVLALGVFVFSVVGGSNETEHLAFATIKTPQTTIPVINEQPLSKGAGGPEQQAPSQEVLASPTTTKNAFSSPKAEGPLFLNIRRTIEPGTKLPSLPAKNSQGLGVHYVVTQGAFPGTILLNVNGEFSGTVFTSGRSVTKVQATDPDRRVTTLSVEVVVQNGLPRFSSASSNSRQELLVGQTPLPLVAIDPNQEQLTFSKSGGTLPEGLSLASNGSFDGKALQAGEYSLNVITFDPAGAQVATTLQLIVGPLKAEPTMGEPLNTTTAPAAPAKPTAAAKPSPTKPTPTPTPTKTPTKTALVPKVGQGTDSRVNETNPRPGTSQIPPPIPLKPPVPVPSKSPPRAYAVATTALSKQAVSSTTQQTAPESARPLPAPPVSTPPSSATVPPVVSEPSPATANPQQNSEVTGTRSRLDDVVVLPELGSLAPSN